MPATVEHWDKIYRDKPPQSVSWYRPHLETSLALIERAAPDRASSIIDVGGGASTLSDDLLASGYRNLTVIDLSQTAIAVAVRRLGSASTRIHWVAADILSYELPANVYDVWHDRATFHFLTTESDRADYVRRVARAVKPGGYVLISTFGLEGPYTCSGLEVARYDADSLHAEFGVRFRTVSWDTEPQADDPLGFHTSCRYIPRAAR
jgi:2-polyprenyl-3-methyl-5-hydroxy-6-metoxy-1,4-benzoquinol methylase